MRTPSLTVLLTLLVLAPAQAQVTIGFPVVTVPTTPTTSPPPEIPPEARQCPLPRKLHQKPKSPQNWKGLYQDRIVVKLLDDAPLEPMSTMTGPAFRALDASVSTAQLQALNAALAGKRAMARQHGSVPVGTLAKWRSEAQSRSCERMPDLSQYYRVYLAKGEDPMQVVAALNASPLVEIAFLPPFPVNADVPPATQDLESQQGYLSRSAQGGIGATDAWKILGARGAGMRVVDVEVVWNVNHEDLRPPFWFSGLPTANEIATAANGSGLFPDNGIDHGTAVVGEMVAKDDGRGVTGIAADAEWGGSSVIRAVGPCWVNLLWYGPVSFQDAVVADAIVEAQDHVRAGDVILIEQHAPGPDSAAACPGNCTQYEYIALEYFPDSYDAIRTATARGIVVVEAAGNGNMNLDAIRYDDRFDRSFRDSHAILVGGSSGRVPAPDAGIQRNGSSNWGSRLDVSGWGANVTTTGYGDGLAANGPNDPNQFYTNTFGGTSSASPIVAGAALSIQGVMRASERGLLTPTQLRSLLTETGTAEQTPVSRRIGPLVNLDAALAEFDTGTAAVGGNGGTPFTLRCPSDLQLVGVKGGAGWLIDRVQAICGTPTGGTQLTSSAGGPGGSSFELRCPAGKVVTGISGRAGGYVDSIRLRCDDPFNPGNIDFTSTAGGNGGAVYGPNFCPPNRVAVGLRGRAGLFVDRLQLLCSAAPVPPVLTSWISGAVGGTGGTYANLRCNDDEVLVGVSGRGEWYVDSLAPRCVRVTATGAWDGPVRTGARAGGTGGTTEVITCPEGRAVSGISGRAASVVDRLTLHCRDLIGPQQTSGGTNTPGSVGGSGGESFGRIDCPSNLPAHGFAVWTGWYVDRLKLVCGH